MINLSKKTKSLYTLIPLLGIFIFIVLYFTATLYYPGGSQADKDSSGFSWVNNYWCNLLNEKAINGQPNPARSIAMFAMIILCFSLAFFWIILPASFNIPKKRKLLIQLSGIISMLTAGFIFTKFHDEIINIAGFFGLLAIIGTYTILYQNKWKRLFYFGIFNLLLIVLNNILYYGKNLIIYLPFVQKISFLSFLLWICLIDINLFHKSKFSHT